MRRLLAVAALCALLLGCMAAQDAAHAAIIGEDIAYWYQLADTSPVQTVFNPSLQWLTDNRDFLLIKIQQTVYDPVQCAEILTRDGQNVVNGYLYAYSVSNLNWNEGITSFSVNWAVQPLLVTKSSRTTPSFWSVNGGVTYPEWVSTPSNIPGIAPGETVGGFWAVSDIGNDQVGVGAVVGSITTPLGTSSYMLGETSGPMVPDPASILTLAMGMAGFGLTRVLRRR